MKEITCPISLLTVLALHLLKYLTVLPSWLVCVNKALEGIIALLSQQIQRQDVQLIRKQSKYTAINNLHLYSGMCPQWSAVVGTDHHSEKIATTINSLTSTKISNA